MWGELLTSFAMFSPKLFPPRFQCVCVSCLVFGIFSVLFTTSSILRFICTFHIHSVVVFLVWMETFYPNRFHVHWVDCDNRQNLLRLLLVSNSKLSIYFLLFGCCGCYHSLDVVFKKCLSYQREWKPKLSWNSRRSVLDGGGGGGVSEWMSKASKRAS